jgi:glycosyltransferase involved in cell wall biosynthesis
VAPVSERGYGEIPVPLQGLEDLPATSPIAVIMPAHRAEATIVEAVRSVVAQTWPSWRLVVIADDEVDYEAVLGRSGLRDPRFTFLSSGTIGGGASRARNLALDAMDVEFAAILDADDRFKPKKLELSAAAVATHAIVSSALDVMDDQFRHLRYVGRGEDRLLTAGRYKWTSISMDSMIVWNRRKTDARYDLNLTNMTDLELLMRLWRNEVGCWHLGEPAHDYVKLSKSMSNGPGVTEKMIASKTELLRRLDAGKYPMADPDGPAGIAAFLRVSLEAERTYPAVLAGNPTALFEDTIEPLLAAAQAGSAASTSAA